MVFRGFKKYFERLKINTLKIQVIKIVQVIWHISHVISFTPLVQQGIYYYSGGIGEQWIFQRFLVYFVSFKHLSATSTCMCFHRLPLMVNHIEVVLLFDIFYKIINSTDLKVFPYSIFHTGCWVTGCSS